MHNVVLFDNFLFCKLDDVEEIDELEDADSLETDIKKKKNKELTNLLMQKRIRIYFIRVTSSSQKRIDQRLDDTDGSTVPLHMRNSTKATSSAFALQLICHAVMHLRGQWCRR